MWERRRTKAPEATADLRFQSIAEGIQFISLSKMKIEDERITNLGLLTFRCQCVWPATKPAADRAPANSSSLIASGKRETRKRVRTKQNHDGKYIHD